MKIFKYLIFLLVVFSNQAFSSIDSTVVQTFTFDSLYNRRATFDLPNSNESYRKILMEYRLKCDPRTAHDKYNCGEWDYLTYNVIYKKLGVMDSTITKDAYLYKLNYLAKDTFEYSDKQGWDRYLIKNQVRTITAFDKDTFKLDINSGTKTYNFNSAKNRIQLYYTKAELKSLGLSKGTFNRIALNSTSTVELSKMTVKISNSSLTNTTRFANNPELIFDTYFCDKFSVKSGWNEITLNQDYTWNGFTGIIIDISFEKGTSDFNLSGVDTTKSIFSNTEDNYLKFDGKNDYVFLGSMPKMNGINQFTFETWFRVDEWNKWATLFGNGQNQIELGEVVGDLYMEIRPLVNSYAKLASTIKIGAWTHIAVVWDGTQSNNSYKMKLYLNGELQSITNNAVFPDKTSSADLLYSFSNMSTPANSLNGAMNETRIWNYALSETEIKTNFSKTLNPTDFDYKKLIAYYAPTLSSDKMISEDKVSLSKIDGKLIGIPRNEFLEAEDLCLNQQQISFKPTIRLMKSVFQSKTETITNTVDAPKEPSTLVKYKVENFKQIPDQITPVYTEKFNYTYNGRFPISTAIADSAAATYNKITFANTKFNFISNIFEKTEPFEIGRFITPYGINLDLGPEGFCWTYDVTDYADLLKGKIDFAVGNQQELVDVKFIFIKGTPPRNLLTRTKVWGNFQSVSYGELSNDDRLTETKVNINSEAKEFKLKTRLTGHGHNSNDGKPPHCCEWKDNIHYLYINGQEAANWSIWQTLDCGTNPVYPQGGTWPHAREGWCPGDLVKDYDFEVTKFIQPGTSTIDYDITPVPDNNKGMAGGNYWMNFELLQYSAVNFAKDAEIYDVVAPSNNQYYSRKNPICSPPVLKIRNNGNADITSLKITYHVSGGQVSTFDWANKVGIKPHSTATIEMPIAEANFWVGDSKKYFYSTITEVNGTKDDYADNDTYISSFNMPDILGVNPVFALKTNLRGGDFSYKITDMKGKEIFNRGSLLNNTNYIDTLRIPEGCYNLKIFDIYGYGLSYWNYPEQGSGSLRVLNNKGALIKAFNPDCGFGYDYSFYVGNYNYVEENNFETLVDLYPNPASDFFSYKSKYEMGLSDITVTSLDGTVIIRDKSFIGIDSSKKYSIADYPPGLYYLSISNGTITINKKFIKE